MRVFRSVAVLLVAPVVISSALTCRGYETPLPWYKATCRVMLLKKKNIENPTSHYVDNKLCQVPVFSHSYLVRYIYII